jgi:hypothetical protein
MGKRERQLDRMMIAYSKWLEALELHEEGLLSYWELGVERGCCFRGVAKISACRKVWQARRNQLIFYNQRSEGSPAFPTQVPGESLTPPLDHTLPHIEGLSAPM